MTLLAARPRPIESAASIRGLGGVVLSRGDLVLVIDNVGLYVHQGRAVGVDAWVRLFRHGREVPVDPHRIFINPPLKHRGGFDPRGAFEHILWDSVMDTPNPKGWRTRGTVTTFFSQTSDEGLISYDASGSIWSDAVNGLGDLAFDTDTNTGGDGTTISLGNFIQTGLAALAEEGFFSFDTSSLSGQTVSQVDFSLFEHVSGLLFGTDVSGGTVNFQVRPYNFGASVTTADWRTAAQYNALTILATLDGDTIVSDAYNAFAENGTNFQTAINTTGTTYLIVSNAHQASTTPPSDGSYIFEVYAADQAGTTNDPKLVVTHAAAAATTRMLGTLGVGT